MEHLYKNLPKEIALHITLLHTQLNKEALLAEFGNKISDSYLTLYCGDFVDHTDKYGNLVQCVWPCEIHSTNEAMYRCCYIQDRLYRRIGGVHVLRVVKGRHTSYKRRRTSYTQ
jgi:hypothetical protein